MSFSKHGLAKFFCRGESTAWLHVTNITGKEGYVKASKKTVQKKGRLRKMQTTMMMSNVFGFFGFYFEIKTKPKKPKKSWFLSCLVF